MKHTPYTHLKIYHGPVRESNRFLTQKNMDLAVMVVSLAGLISAMTFLFTMS